MKQRKKLIEVALPLEAINVASAREKSIRHGHPSTLHLWWARRPLAAARSVIFAQMVDDPGSYVDELREDRVKRATAEKELKKRQAEYAAKQKLAKKAQVPEPEPTLDGVLAELERDRLFKIIEDLVLWENTTNETVLNKARTEIWSSWTRACKDNADHPRADELFNPEKLPGFHDPFAGGGALPLEAQRLGLEAYASDLNPVAVLINKAMIEIPPKFAGLPPVSLGARASRSHKGWHSRGYLPHCDTPGLLQSVTFRLDDALPRDVVEALAEEADSPEKRERIENLMDAGHGECWLRQPRLASLVEDALLHFDGERYRLIAWCIMPNHVHALIETREGFPLDGVIHSWKSFTAKEINKALARDGAVWQPDYYDRFIRDGKHLEATVSYIEDNPVKAGLVQAPEEWVYGSAAKRSMEEKEDASETLALPGADSWTGAQGLAEDVRYYGQWMRGVLRIMASVIHVLWERQDPGLLIMPSSIPLDELTVQPLLTYYLEDPWIPVIERDIDGPNSLPLQLDQENPNLGRYSATRRVSRTVFMGSAPLQHSANKGLEDRQIRLGCAQPGESVATFGDSLRRLADRAYHLYVEGNRYWYSTQQTVLRLAQDRASQYDRDTVLEEIEKRLRKEAAYQGDFVKIHACPGSTGDVPDDRETRLVILRPELCHSSNSETSPARLSAAELFEKHGNGPRHCRNALVFVAADKARLVELEQAVRQYLAWISINNEAETLNLDASQAKQAVTKREQADETVKQRIPETYQWLLVPTQPSPTDNLEWQQIRLQGQDTLAAKASRKLKSDGILVEQMAGVTLRLELDRIPLWRGEHVEIRQLIDDFAQYTYLPKLKSPDVLLAAVQDGVQLLTWKEDAFAYASGWDEAKERYSGLKAGVVTSVGATWGRGA